MNEYAVIWDSGLDLLKDAKVLLSTKLQACNYNSFPSITATLEPTNFSDFLGLTESGFLDYSFQKE